MKLRNKEFTVKQMIAIALYYSIARWLPESGRFFNIGGVTRRFLCKNIFRYIGEHVNIERGAWFGSGTEIQIGDYSGLGINCHIPNGTILGKYIMMGPNCWIHDVNHNISDINTPMCFQGMLPKKITVIEDDVWIGRNVSMTPGRHILKGTVIGMCSCVTKDFPEYSILGGVPARFIKSRKN